MPQTRDIALEQLTASDDALGAIGMRVDPAHSLGAALVGLLPLTQMPVGRAITDLVQGEGALPLRRPSSQPASPLLKREQELRHREAYVDARLADLQREVDDARRWLRERSGKLDERETRLNERDAEISAREATLGQPAAALTKPAGDPAPAASERATEADWQARVQALVRAREQLARRRAVLEEFWRESSRAHQRAQELRLLSEELVTELRNSLDVARARDAVTAIRQRLAQHPRTEEPRLTDPRGEFQWLKNDLATEDQRLERQHEELTRTQGTASAEQPAARSD